MDTNIILGIIFAVISVALIILVLLQHGKAHGLSGTIAGGSETFFGKNKSQTIDKRLSILTAVLSVVFVAAAIVAFVIQDI